MGEEVYHVTGEVELEGGASFLHCSVNGMKSRPKLVILDNTVHLFSTVSPSHRCWEYLPRLSVIYLYNIIQYI